MSDLLENAGLVADAFQEALPAAGLTFLNIYTRTPQKTAFHGGWD